MTPRIVSCTLAVLISLGLPLPILHACIWDSDTLQTEQSRFPGVFEMITGQFPRHSNEFYTWRIERAKRLVAENPQDLAAYDDWAVAEHKLGRNPEAIRIMNEARTLAPKRYESLSNLGTFHLFEDNLAESCELLREALQVNPDAHFGREKYQLWLADLLLRQKTAATIEAEPKDQPPILLGGGKMQKDLDAFLKRSETKLEAEWLGRSAPSADAMRQAQRNEAITAVLGMMRFARHDHPLLLETLGDLLAGGDYRVDANRLAAFAYLRASQTAQSPVEQDRLHRISKRLISGTHGSSMSFEMLDQQLSEGLAQGDLLQAQVRADEIAWIRDGKDAQAEFEKKYLK